MVPTQASLGGVAVWPAPVYGPLPGSRTGLLTPFGELGLETTYQDAWKHLSRRCRGRGQACWHVALCVPTSSPENRPAMQGSRGKRPQARRKPEQQLLGPRPASPMPPAHRVSFLGAPHPASLSMWHLESPSYYFIPGSDGNPKKEHPSVRW